MKLRIAAAARRDLERGYRFYEAQGEGLGNYFLDALFSDIDSLRLYAGVHPQVWNGYHRLLARRFPYAIYYRLDDEVVFIYAVLDCRRNPETHEKRLRR
ncbi:type II toxin-antitoxin system RelE/ParE family toxin [Desulfuromonas acetexigens]|jgi:plasmid stabilization system protein ParE|uniref:Type II toxin-antitoxin system RelE/ParE family toxin n=1 Tax=Trichloromonas acetexigens TaxID=38815 RepID=A0A550JJ28_9BACT|nr:type II toxin-antitoxin system RelE/ParE family toxin [Desulfuromonas acetexigens]TRO83217.1 type II toxin-antitoxin system RelE/ParE family toxin [Desulfuromonas acetexigens]